MAQEMSDRIVKDEEPQPVQDETSDQKQSPEAVSAAVDSHHERAEQIGRKVAVGVLVVTILTLIAVGIAGFVVSSENKKPSFVEELSLNEPAPALWDKLKTPDLKDQPLGVTGALLNEVKLKSRPAPVEAPKDSSGGKE